MLAYTIQVDAQLLQSFNTLSSKWNNIPVNKCHITISMEHSTRESKTGYFKFVQTIIQELSKYLSWLSDRSWYSVPRNVFCPYER